MRVKLKEVAQEKGVSLYLVSKKVRVRYEVVLDFSAQKHKCINLKLLEKFCEVLDAKPSEIVGN